MSLVRGDAVSLPLADESVDLIVTSPPYFALRSYTDGGKHYDGQIGSEATPQAFLEALWAVTAECRRVLKPSGSMWVNLGDSYAGNGARYQGSDVDPGRSGTANGKTIGAKDASGTNVNQRRAGAIPGIRGKSLCGLPWLYALGCTGALAALGGPDPGLDLILRAEVIWSKPNGLPESVTDRVRRSHEQWFMFTKEPRYFSAVDEIRESRSEVVEARPEHLPGCPLFVAPSDTLRPRTVGRRHEGVTSVELFDLPDEVGADERVERHHVTGTEQEHEVGSRSASVPLLVGGDADLGADPSHLLDDRLVAAVDVEAKVWAAGATVGEGDRSLTVDDPRQPGQVCTCAHATYPSGLGKLPGSVWTIPSEPLKVPAHIGVDHFAAFPQEWPRRLILGWSPSGICLECGEGRRPVVAKELEHVNHTTNAKSRRGNEIHPATKTRNGKGATNVSRETATITGYACACDTPTAPTRPAVVLDPFGGTGTVAMVARALGRYPVHIDLSRDYLRLARWRVYESGHAAKSRERTNREAQATLDLGAA